MFDPFGDFDTAGYLRNTSGLKDPESIKVQEHLFFTTNLPEAAAYLATRKVVTYKDFCKVHEILFSGFYPWAGQDRLSLQVASLVNKGATIQFESSDLAQRAVEHGLNLGNDPKAISNRPGEVMGMFAWGHPFLDGNGRTMVVVHSELMARAKLRIHWEASRKNEYLIALTKELESPRDLVLDAYLKPLVQPIRSDAWIEAILTLPGLDGSDEEIGADIAYEADDPEGLRRYAEAQKRRRYEIPDNRS